MGQNASRGAIPGLGCYGRDRRRINFVCVHSRCLHHHLDVEALLPYPLMIVDKHRANSPRLRPHAGSWVGAGTSGELTAGGIECSGACSLAGAIPAEGSEGNGGALFFASTGGIHGGASGKGGGAGTI